MRKVESLLMMFVVAILISCSADEKPENKSKSDEKQTMTEAFTNEVTGSDQFAATKSDTGRFQIGLAEPTQSDRKTTKWQKYDIKSGIVEYELSGISGKEIVYWDNYGALEARYTKTSISRDGATIENEVLLIYNDSLFYSLSIKEKQGMKINMNKHIDAKNMQVFNKEMLNEIGGKQKGTEKILGRECTIWEMPDGIKISLYKEIPFRLVFGDVKVIARDFKENATIEPSKFIVPKGFDIKTPEEVDKMRNQQTE